MVAQEKALAKPTKEKSLKEMLMSNENRHLQRRIASTKPSSKIKIREEGLQYPV